MEKKKNNKKIFIIIAVVVVLALIVAFNHRANIQRILNGTENKLSFKK